MDTLENLVLLDIGTYSLTLSMLIKALIALMLTRLIEWLLVRLVKRFQLIKKIPIEDQQVRTAVRTLRFMAWVAGAVIALNFLGFDIRKGLDATLFSIPYKDQASEVKVVNVLIAILIFTGARLGIWYFYRLFVRLGESKRIPLNQGRRMAVYQIFKYIIYGVALILILTNLHINLDLLIASSAALFLGVGLAMQHIFEDLVSGMIILFEGTVEVGDMVVVDSLNLEGKVMEVRLRTSIVETLDSVSVIVPNSKFIRSNVVNWSFNDRETRFHVAVLVAYGSDVQLVRKVMRSCATSHGLVLKQPEPRVRFSDFGESGLRFELLFWTLRSYEYLDIMSDLRYKIDAEFRRHDIRIPFPQRDLHIVSDFRQVTTAGGDDAPAGGLPLEANEKRKKEAADHQDGKKQNNQETKQ
jgi:small-conductance mechanosensitive channel